MCSVKSSQYSSNEPPHKKTTICMCEKTDTDQLCSNCTADQCLCFRYIDHKFQVSASMTTGQFVPDLVGNTTCFSDVKAQMTYTLRAHWLSLQAFLDANTCLGTT